MNTNLYKKRSSFLILGLFFLLLSNAFSSSACSLSITPAVTYTCTGNGKDGVVTLNISGGTAPYVIVFNGTSYTGISVNNPQFTGLAQGTYSFSVTDLLLCTGSGNVTVSKNTLPLARVTGGRTICAGSSNSIALGNTTVSGNTYSWVSNPSGFTSSVANPSVNPTQTTTYTLTETNANGCSKSNSVTINVNQLPSVAVGADNNQICVQGKPIKLHGTPAGGTFSGDGVTDSTFDPSYAGIGTHTITYYFTNSNGCSNMASTQITVQASPNLNISTPYTSICVDGGSFGLTGTPSGGFFIGDGITDTIFDPAAAGIGGHTITYYYTTGNGCSFSESITIRVNALPNVSLSNKTVCANAGKFTIPGVPPGMGGVYSGTGVSGSTFDPGAAGPGSYTINFVYTDSNGCTASTSATYTVLPIPSVSIGSFADVCANAGSQTLSGGSPSGGVYSGTGVASGVFNPSNATIGNNTITYTYTSSNGCSNTASSNIKVNALPVISFSAQSFCINAGKYTMNASPSGGTYSGTGVSGSTFDPASAGAGTFAITYSYTDNNGCANSKTVNYTVNALPTVSAGTYAAVCVNGSAVTLQGSPAGGTFSGNGVSNGVFNPANANIGTNTITYSYTNSNGCSNTATTTITVYNVIPASISSYSNICIGTTPFALTAFPGGGTFSGDGVSAGYFNPMNAGSGNHTITYSYTNTNGCTTTASTVINVGSGAVAKISVDDNEQCLSSNSFSFADSSTATAGTINSWNWNFGDNSTSTAQNPTHSYAAAGTYTVTLTAGSTSGCSGTATMTVTVDALPNVSFTSNTAAACQGSNSFTFTDKSTSSAQITGWAWDFGDSVGTSSAQNPTYHFNTAGSYKVTLTATDAHGCSANFNKSVTVYPMPAAAFSASAASQCLSSGAISFTDGSSVGSGNMTSWKWNFGDNGTSTSQNPSHTYTAAGTYTVTLISGTAQGCTDTAASTITILALPAANAGSAQTICPGGSATLGATEVAGSTYSWTSNPSGFTSSDNNPVVSPSATTTYILTETNADGCSAANSVTVTVAANPVAKAGSDQNLCAGSSTTVGAASVSGLTYSWTSIPSGFTSTAANPAVSPSTTTVYVVKAANSNGCSATDTAVVTVVPLPAANAGSSQTINSGSSTSIGGTAISGSTYAWTSSPSGFTSTLANPTVSPATTTTYTLTETNANGCKKSNSVTITVNTGTAPTITVTGATTFCSGGSVKLTSSSATTYQWYNASGAITGATAQSYTATASGSYYVKVYKNFVYSTSASVTVTVNALPAAATGGNVSICQGGSVTIGADPVSGSSYKWTAGNASCGSKYSTSSKITVNPGYSTTYTLTETNANGCTASNNVTVTVVAPPKVTLSAFADVCVDAGTITLTGGSPTGGVYTFDGKTAATYNTTTAGVGNHSITYTYTNSTGCSNSASSSVKIRSAISRPSISANGSTSFCSGGSVKLTSSKADAYQWSNQNGPIISGGNDRNLIATTSGTYYVTVTQNGCSKTSDGITVSVNATPVANAGSDVTYNYGYDDSPVLTGSSNISGSSYKWSTGETTQSITVSPTKTTTYWLTVSKNGCTSSKSYVTVYVRDVHCNDKKDKDRDKKCVMCHYDGKKKAWGHCSVLKSDVNSHKSSGDKFDDCSDFGSVTGDEDANSINIYPNPFMSTANININFAKAQRVSVELWSMDGKLVKTIYSGNVLDATPYNFTIDGNAMMPGIYFVKITGDSHVDVRKIDLLK